MRELELKLGFLVLILFWAVRVESECSKGCDLALASYNLWVGANMTFVSTIFGTSLANIQSFNPQVSNTDTVDAGTRINVPFSCNCIDRQYLGHNFTYDVKSADTYKKIAHEYFANLTTVEWLKNTNIHDENRIPNDAKVNVIVNCSCGNKKVSKLYGLFLTYPLSPGENLSSIAYESNLPSELLQSYNPKSDFNTGSGLVFIPAKDQSGNYPPLILSTGGISKRAIAGISAGGVAGAIFLSFCLYLRLYRHKKDVEVSFRPEAKEDLYVQHGLGSGYTSEKTSESAALVAYPGLAVSVDKSVEFSYDELAKATNDFSMVNKIGQGGFGAVYYAELRGEKAAIKKMKMQASKEFLAELKILTNVHHVNLVRLIGYCVEGSLFLVYEFIENGNLRQHLQGSGKETLPWSTRIQIALDSATGLEYIHEHTVPMYIHRDIKSENILINKNFRAKVADFGLTKLTDVGSDSMLTEGPKGTVGYMSPEYGLFGEFSSKTDVYAFGVVLYEIISAKGAITMKNGNINEPTGLVSLFDDALSEAHPKEELKKLVDPRLGDDYPLDSLFEMAQIAKACTQEKAELRPSMREIVVALVALSSSTEDWNVRPLIHDNQALANLMSGR